MSAPAPVALGRLNAMSAAAAAHLLAEVCERAPEIAAAVVARRPFATVAALHRAILAELSALPEDRRIEFFNRHPDLAGPAAPRPHRAALTADSAREQSAAGLDRLALEQSARLAEWSAEYRQRFGFPFIICALRHSRDAILGEFALRRSNDCAAERDNALAEIGRITALRLVRRVSGPGLPPVHGKLSTHLLDTAGGRPAGGVPIELYLLSESGADLVAATISNPDGRPDKPLIADRPVPNGTYELRFRLADYLLAAGAPAMLGTVPVRFTTGEPEAHYHIPLLFTPWGYSTYRGS